MDRNKTRQTHKKRDDGGGKIPRSRYLGWILVACVGLLFGAKLGTALAPRVPATASRTTAERQKNPLPLHVLPATPQMETFSGFLYPVGSDIGAAPSTEQTGTTRPGLSDEQRLALSDVQFTEDAEVPPEFNIE